MKTVKRILAVAVAVLLIAMMIPVSASAADVSFTLDYTPQGDADFTAKTGKDAFQFTVYQLATLNEADGTYTKVNDPTNQIFAAITDADVANILSKCDSAGDAFDNVEAFETFNPATEDDDNTTAGKQKTISAPAGIYYVKATTVPTTVKSVTNSIVSLPYNQNGTVHTALDGRVKLASKVFAGTEFVNKVIVDGKISDKITTAEKDEYVQFKLTASVVGSVDEPLTAYSIADIMDAGLTFTQDTTHPVTVKLTGKDLADQTLAASDFTVNTAPSFTDDTTNYTFAVVLASNILNTNKKFVNNTKDFYDYTNVEVTCWAKLNANAEVAPQANVNHDDLFYSNTSVTDHKVTGNDVKVYTFKLKVQKVDAATKAGLAGAEFKVYASKEDANNATTDKSLASATSQTGGYATFDGYKFDADKTYYIKETKAPKNYNLNTTVYAIKTDKATITDAGVSSPSDGVLGVQNSFQFPDTKSVLPQTGGNGTLIFTIVGGSLVLLAAALFVIVMKKRSSAK